MINMDQKIIQALANTELLVRPNIYNRCGGEEPLPDSFITFTYSTAGEDFADDLPRRERYRISVHVYCPLSLDSVSLRQQIKQDLFDAGFSWPCELNQGDELGQHYVFQTDWFEWLNLAGPNPI